ncbi:hypothetical protein NTGZN8_160051 [Candidatus Nitrotoga fabula]|uniref:Uncharacterized protein n=1 Tax=Candidatus Nitrotoga fabula TaxID=2182327 RepID=A0A916BFH4_9PROT|nr:hypothetical protein NTGZN8_160051 [Candidatus Nitrotoga fabula]
MFFGKMLLGKDESILLGVSFLGQDDQDW